MSTQSLHTNKRCLGLAYLRSCGIFICSVSLATVTNDAVACYPLQLFAYCAVCVNIGDLQCKISLIRGRITWWKLSSVKITWQQLENTCELCENDDDQWPARSTYGTRLGSSATACTYLPEPADALSVRQPSSYSEIYFFDLSKPLAQLAMPSD